MKSLSSRAALYGLFILLGLLSGLPNLLPARIADQLPTWYSNNTVALGLDLRGGSHLLLDVDTRQLMLDQHQRLADTLGQRLRAAGIPAREAAATEAGVRIQPAHPAHPAQMEDLVRLARELVEDTSGASSYSVKLRNDQLVVTPTRDYRDSLASDTVERTVEVIRRRLDESGLVEPSITRQGSTGVLVQLPGVEDPRQVRQLLGTTARMTFHWAAASAANEKGGTLNLPDGQGNAYQLERRVALAGEHIRDARLAYHPETGEPVVTFRLDDEGARRFAEMTRHNIGRALAVVLDGRVITAPVIRDLIAGGSGEISGDFSAAEASDLALLLRAGALPAPLEVVEERTVGPDLGSDAIAMGVSAGVLGALLVIAFMFATYGRWGLIACVGLTLNIGLIFGVLSLVGATLTLPGIAGIILSIGMAVDANILINERIREEVRRGKSAWSALDQGFRRAYGTILDSNLTTLIAVSLLFLFGSGPVRGFAVTIGIGLLTSMFSAIAVTRLLMEWRVRRMGRRPLHIGRSRWVDHFSSRPINFMRGRVGGLIASAVLSLAAVCLFIQPGLKYGIDFSGGTLVEVRVPGVSVEEFRQALEDSGHTTAAIQEFGDGGRYLVRLPAAGEDSADRLKDSVIQGFSDAEFPRVEMVGPKVSGNFTDATLLAILLAGAGMLAYLWIRFESHFAVAATLTIALDLTKTIGFFALAGIEFNLTAVAALLALIGYSVNDKVVVFDRIRENLRLTPKAPLLPLLNASITSTLTRTLFTSVTTALALLPMALVGGAAVASFALPMLFGILVGTSSSIFVAAPIVYFLGQRRSNKGMAQLRRTPDELARELAAMP